MNEKAELIWNMANIINHLSDEDLINFMNEEVNRHQKIRDSLMNLLEECVND